MSWHAPGGHAGAVQPGGHQAQWLPPCTARHHESVACAGSTGSVGRASGTRLGCRDEPGQQDGEPTVMAAGGEPAAACECRQAVQRRPEDLGEQAQVVAVCVRPERFGEFSEACLQAGRRGGGRERQVHGLAEHRVVEGRAPAREIHVCVADGGQRPGGVRCGSAAAAVEAAAVAGQFPLITDVTAPYR
jgi:hypothetical protein